MDQRERDKAKRKADLEQALAKRAAQCCGEPTIEVIGGRQFCPLCDADLGRVDTALD